MTATSRPDPAEDSAAVFAALGATTRLRLVARLCAGGPQSIASLTGGTRLTRQAIAKHLRVLADAGVVRGARRGRESRWEVEPSRLGLARRYLARISGQWSERLEALRRHVEEAR